MWLDGEYVHNMMKNNFAFFESKSQHQLVNMISSCIQIKWKILGESSHESPYFLSLALSWCFGWDESLESRCRLRSKQLPSNFPSFAPSLPLSPLPPSLVNLKRVLAIHTTHQRFDLRRCKMNAGRRSKFWKREDIIFLLQQPSGCNHTSYNTLSSALNLMPLSSLP